MKERRHHNNTGFRQIKRGKTAKQVEDIAKMIFSAPVYFPGLKPFEGLLSYIKRMGKVE